ncbi:MAG: DUF4058 family protein, partial [Chloroflexi bacterium]|nr:DUF4058 family protein [Chloroflexota bacterium]
LVNVEIRDVARNRLVTAIEILSPANKRGPGLDNYRVKRDRLRQAGVHVLEIDLLRRGVRLWPAEYLPDSPYLAVLLRAGNQRAEVWLIGLRENLPVLPVPLRYPDPDTPLDLQAALSVIYDEARYDLTLSYEAPPPPPSLAQADALWALQCVQVWAGRVVSFRQPPSPVAPPAT